MNQKKMSVMLEIIAVIAVIMLLIFLVVLMPMLASECREIYPKSAYLYIPGICYGWYLGILCLTAVCYFLRICNEIGKDNSFSKENMHSLNIIGIIAIIAAASWFIVILILIFIGSMSIAFFALMTLAVIVSLAIAVIATVLSHLVQKAYEIKEENDLTI